MDKGEKYWAGFSAGENLYEFSENECDEWKQGYADGVAQTFEDCPEWFV